MSHLRTTISSRLSLLPLMLAAAAALAVPTFAHGQIQRMLVPAGRYVLGAGRTRIPAFCIDRPRQIPHETNIYRGVPADATIVLSRGGRPVSPPIPLHQYMEQAHLK